MQYTASIPIAHHSPFSLCLLLLLLPAVATYSDSLYQHPFTFVFHAALAYFIVLVTRITLGNRPVLMIISAAKGASEQTGKTPHPDIA